MVCYLCSFKFRALVLIRKKIYLVALGCLFFLNVKSQQNRIYSLYMYNTILINPAYAGGIENKVNTNAISRLQWQGISEGFTSYSLSAHFPLASQKLGLGFRLQKEESLVQDRSEFGLIGSYKIHFLKGYLSFGLDASIVQFREDFSNLTIKQSEDVLAANTSGSLFDLNTGLHYTARKFYVSTAIRNMSFLYTERSRSLHFYLLAARKFKLNQYSELFLSSIVRVNNQSLIFEYNLQYRWNEMLWIGGALRSYGQFGLQTGARLDKLVERLNDPITLAYAIDFGNGELYKQNVLVHEIMLSYTFKLRPSVSSILNSREHVSPLFF